MSISRKLMASSGGRTYLVAANRVAAPNGGIGVVDITEPSSMVHVGDFAGANVDDPGQLAFDPNRRFAAVCGGALNNVFSVFDLKEPLAPFETDDFSIFFSTGPVFSEDGNYLFLGLDTGGVLRVAITDNGTITSGGGVSDSGVVQQLVLAYDGQRDFLFGGSGSNYFTVMSADVSGSSPFSISDWLGSPAFDGVIRVRHDDDAQILFTYVSTPNYEFSAVDTSNPSSLSLLSALNIVVSPRDFDIDPTNQIAYVLNNTSLRSVDYSNPSAMVVLDTLSVGSNNGGISYYDGHVFITAFGGAVYSVDVSDPASMALVDTLSGLSGNYYQSAIVQT